MNPSPAATSSAAGAFVSALCLGVLALGLTACGDSDDGSGKPPFPIRQLESVAAAPAAGAALDDEFGSLDGWWALVTQPDGSFQLHPADATPGLRRHEHGVIVPAGSALVRLVRVREALAYTLHVDVNGPLRPAGEQAPQVQLIGSRKANDLTLTHGEPPSPAAAAQLAGLLSQKAGSSLARWVENPDTGLPEVRIDCNIGDRPAEEIKALVVLAAWSEDHDYRRVRLLTGPQLRHGYDPSSEVPKGQKEIAIEGIKLSGEWRLSALVPAGQTLRLPINVPEGAVDVTLGVCPEPGARTGASVTWSVTLRPGGQVLGEVTERIEKDRVPRFRDHLFPWPEGVEGPVTVEFVVQGDVGMIFGQPKVRGPELSDAPSLLFISIDTLRADHIGFLGYDRATTPFLDTLAKDAAVFTDVASAASYTLPAHATMFTGLFPPRHMALDSADRLDAERTPTLGRLLADAGFHTAGFTGGGFVSVDYGFAAGFDRYTTVDPVAVPPYIAPGPDGVWPNKAQIERARQNTGLKDVYSWIARQGHRRWYAFVHTFATHEYDPPEEDRVLFERDLGLPAGWSAQERLNKRSLVDDPPTRAELDRLIDLYDATIHHVDRRLGDLIMALRTNHLLDNTVIVVTSDHGEEFLEHGRLRHNGSLYQELVHVPLLIDLPGEGPALRIDAPVSQADILPTVLELLGVAAPEGLDGHSLTPLLHGESERLTSTPQFSHLDRTVHGRSSLRQGSWKIIHSDTSAERHEPAASEWELYDLRIDPLETHDLMTTRPPELGRMQGLLGDLEAWLAEHRGVRQSATLQEDVRQRLIELGYVDAVR